MRYRVLIGVVVASLVHLCNSVDAGVTAIGPFVGTLHENFNQYSSVNAVPSMSVFAGAGTVTNLTSGGSIKLEFSSQFNGDLVVPPEGLFNGMMVGQLGISRWDFAQPVSKFGGLWENNSGQDDATVTFYDAGGNLIDTKIANDKARAQVWTWNGWQSDVPIARIQVVGNGVLNGFLWYDNMEITPAPATPEPSAIALLALGSISFGRRRQRRSQRRSTTR